MFWKKRKGKPSLIEQRDNVRDAIKRAMSRNDDDEVERLEGHLEDLEKKIKRDKNGCDIK